MGGQPGPGFGGIGPLTQVGFDDSTQIGQANRIDIHGGGPVSAAAVQQMNLHVGTRQAAVTGRVGTRADVPPAPSPFVGRDSSLELLHRHAGEPGVAPVLVSGAAGMGKTALLAEYVRQFGDTFATVWWVPCQHPELIASYVTGLADHLGLPPVASEVDAVAAVTTLLGLADRWLLVFDGCGDRSLVQRFLPREGDGAVVVTSRNRAWGPAAGEVDLGPLDTSDAVRLLGELSGLGAHPAAARIVELIGTVPAPVAQAGSHLHASGADPERYLEQRRARAGGQGDTFLVTVEEIRRTEPLAGELLELLAVLDHEAEVPFALLEASAPFLPPSLGAKLADGLELDRLIGVLRRYSVVERSATGIRSLPAVDAVAEAALQPATHGERSMAARQALLALLPEDAGDPARWELVDRLLPHALELTARPEADADVAAWVLVRVAEHLAVLDDAEQALQVAERARQLASAPQARAGALLAVASAHAQADRVAEVLDACDRALRESDDTSTRLGALTYRTVGLTAAGDIAGAVAAGDDTLRTLAATPSASGIQRVRGLLAVATARHTAGDLSRTRELLSAAMAVDIPAGHPTRISVRLRLAGVLQGLGQARAARTLLEGAAAEVDRYLGAHHALHDWSRHALAVADAMDGKVDEAIAVFSEQIDRLSATSAGTAQALGTRLLARSTTLAAKGDTQGAQEDLQRARELLEAHFPDDVRSRVMLLQAQAGLMAGQADPSTASTVLARAAAIAEESLAPSDATVVSVHLQRVQILLASQQLGPAAEVLTALEQTLPANHFARPNVSFLSSMAAVTAGDVDSGIAHMQRAIGAQIALVGAGHPSLASGRAALARMLLMRGAVHEAVSVAQEAVADLVIADAQHELIAFDPLVVLAMSLAASGQVPAAVARLEEAQRLGEARTAPGTFPRGQVLANLAVPWSHIDPERALQLVEGSYEIATALFGAHHPAVMQLDQQRTWLRTQARLRGVGSWLSRLFES